ncbi:MAG TPA: SgcJ/EcaC family oxidoreductase [Polyangiaceae bacterium]|nr:SgcJ/EcaC family oxidoreductase [Polyangiaceae bacterium]
MARCVTLPFLLALATACSKPAPPAEPAIRDALARQADAWNQHDAHAWVAPFSSDAEFVNILGTTLQGRAEIEKRHAEIFNGIFSHSRVQVKTRRVRQLGPTAALAETDYELRDYERLPPGIRPTEADGTLRTRLKYVWALDHDEWKVVAAQNTAILPPPTKP